MTLGEWACSTCGRTRDRAALAATVSPTVRSGYCFGCRTSRLFMVLRDPMKRDAVEGERRKQEGMGRAERAAEVADGWASRFDAHVAGLPPGTQFTSETVTAVIGQPSSSGAVGARMNALAKRGRIRRIGYQQAARVNQHAAIISIWERIA